MLHVGDVDQDVLRSLQVEIVQQGRLEGTGHGVVQPGRACTDAAAHQGHAAVAHHGLDVFEVDVYVAGFADDLGDAPYGGRQHLVGHREGLVHEVAAEVVIELFVVDDQEAVDVLAQFMDAVDGA